VSGIRRRAIRARRPAVVALSVTIPTHPSAARAALEAARATTKALLAMGDGRSGLPGAREEWGGTAILGADALALLKAARSALGVA
jgi:hypothetical protein